MRIALIPVKELSQAKARLAPVLDGERRRELALALYRDVLAAALACPALDGVAVVSRDRDALTLAVEAGAEGLPEPGGLNEALTSASQTMAERGVDRLVVLAADLPLATPDDIAIVAQASAQADADVALVPSEDGGTNALALAPGAIAFRFGPDSARRHLAAADAADLRSLRLELPTLALDIDTPDDLARLRDTDRAIGQNTLSIYKQLHILEGTIG